MAAIRHRSFLLVTALLLLLLACGDTGQDTVSLELPAASEPDDHSTEFDPVDAEPGSTPTATTVATPPPDTTPPLPTPTPTPAERSSPRSVSRCPDFEVPPVPHIVWNVAPDDPDGGLVAHSEPAVEAPVTRVLPWNALAARPTGGCTELPSGNRWYELATPDGAFDWVSSRFLAPTTPACLFGEASGTTKKGDTDAAIGLFGPIDGHAVGDGEYTAFLPPGETTWYWYRSNIYVDLPCYLDGPTGMVCISQARFFDFVNAEPVGGTDEPRTAVRTGRLTLNPDFRGLRDELIEVVPEGSRRPVWFDPAESEFDEGPCGIGQTAQSSCLTSRDPLPDERWAVGSAQSDADHVRDLALVALDDCNRIVIEFGTGVSTDDDRAASLVPPVEIRRSDHHMVISLPDCPIADCLPFTHGPGDPDRVDLPDGIAFVAIDENRGHEVRLEHAGGASGIRIESNPARIVIDLVPTTTDDGATIAPFGEVAILRPLQPEMTGRGMLAFMPVTITGWSRPFESTLSWQVLRVDSVDELRTLPPGVESIELVASGFTTTTGWLTGWGAFEVTLPGLNAGTYAVLFGEFPPSGDLGFVGSGQLIRVVDNANPDPGPFIAELIPRIEVRVPVAQG